MLLAGFYRKSLSELYIDELEFKYMSEDTLYKEIQLGLETYNRLWPSVPFGHSNFDKLMILCAVVIAVAGVASIASVGAAGGTSSTVTASGTASGVSVATPATATLGATVPSVTTATTAAGATTTSTLGMIQQGAGYVSLAGKAYTGATGKNPNEILMLAADFVADPSATAAVETGAKMLLSDYNVKVAEDDVEAQAALNELIQREQDKYAQQLKQLALAEEARTGVPIAIEQNRETSRESLVNVAMIASPFLLYLMSK